MAEMTTDQLRQLVGDASDSQLTEIIGLKPTASEVEQAVGWLNNDGDRLDRAGLPLAGKAGLIFDILFSDDDEP